MNRPRRITAWSTLVLCGVVSAASLSAQPSGQLTARELTQTGRIALERGIVMSDRDALLRALESLERAVEINPAFGDAWAALAHTHYWLDNTAAAETALTRARTLLGFNAATELLGARIAAERSRWEDAARLFEAVLQREPNNADALLGRAIIRLRTSPATVVAREVAALHQRFPHHRRTLLTLAVVTHRAGDTAAAARYLDLALRFFHAEPAVHLLAARLAYEMGDWTLTRRHAQSALALQENLSEALLLAALAAVESNETEIALRTFEELIRTDVTNALGWYDRGVLLERLGRADAAVESFERALRLQTDFEPARIALDNVLVQSMPIEHPARVRVAAPYLQRAAELQERFLSGRAERTLRRGLVLHPYNTELRLALAELYNQQGYYARYLQELEVARTLGADSQALLDALEIYRALQRNSVANRWNVDQFTVARPRTTIAVYEAPAALLAPGVTVARAVAGIPEPLALSEHSARYLRTVLNGTQHLDVSAGTGSIGLASRTQRADTLAQARRDGMSHAVLWHLTITEPYAVGTLELIHVPTARSIAQRRIVRSGNGRIGAVLDEAVAEIGGAITPRGAVLQRRFDTVLISLGKVDGLEPDQTLYVYDGESFIGSARIVALDDLVAEARYAPRADGVDRLRVGQTVRFDAPPDTGSEAAPETSPSRRSWFTRTPEETTPQSEQTSQTLELVKQLLRLR